MKRRDFLKALSAAALTAPLFRTGHLRAQDAGVPQRLILFPSLNGTRDDVFWPDAGGGLKVITEPLQAIRDDVTFVRGLSVEGSYNHFAIRSMFTGAPIADYADPEPRIASVDQLVADALQARHGRSEVRSLHLGARPAQYAGAGYLGRQNIFRSATEAVTVQANPVTAHDALFGAVSAAPQTPAASDFSGDVDAILRAELDALSGRASGVQRAIDKLELHRASLPTVGDAGGDVAQTVDCGSSIASVEALRPVLQGNDALAYADDHLDAIIDAQIDVMAAAVTCGATRVATLQTSWADGDVLMTLEDGSRLPWHPTSHENAGQYAQLQRAYMKKFVRLVQLLDTPDPLDPSGHSRVIDNTCVLWMSECEPNHNADSISCVYAGGAGGALRTGEYLQPTGATNKHLMTSLCRAFGVSNADAGQFGGQALSEVLS